jgi:1-acyl-sn-glycerol-3-phosphate acyltransferase
MFRSGTFFISTKTGDMQMILAFFKRKWEIIRAPMPLARLNQRWFAKPFICCVDDLIQYENPENLILPGPFIFAFNHNSAFETVIVGTSLIHRRNGENISFIIDWMYRYIPIVGWIFKLIDPIYVYHKPSTIGVLNRLRQRPKRTAIEECIDRLKAGRTIGIFPEGTVNRDPKYLLKGQKGIGIIALESGVPVFPIGIDFPKRRRQGKIPAWGRMIYCVGKPLAFPEELAEYRILQSAAIEPSRKKQVINLLAAKITHKVMLEIAALCGKAYLFKEPSADLKTDPALRSGRKTASTTSL